MRMDRLYGDNIWDGVDAPNATSTAATPLAASGRGSRASRRNGKRVESLPAELLPTIELHGVRIHAITERQAIDHILNELDAGRGGTVVTPNLDHIRRSTRDLSFNALLAEADLVVADGMPLIWASKLQGTRLPQRVAGSDLISSLSRDAGLRGKSIFLLGGVEGTAEAASEVLRNANPTLKVVGTYYPPFGFEDDAQEMARLVAKLKAAAPDIVFVALGSPKQENLIQRVRSVLPNAWWLGVGISFSFLCGDVKRAPKFLQRIGLEWVHRLLQDPKRLFHRYIVVGLPFSASLLSRSAAKGMTRWMRRRPSSVAQAIANVVEAETTPVTDTAGTTIVAEPPTAPPMRPRRRSVEGTGHTGSLNRLRAMVLLGGSVRSSALSDACGRSLLDLPLDSNGSIFNHWLAQAADLARHAGIEKLPVRVLVNRNAPEPSSAAPAYYGHFKVERDLSEYRGTGGVLRDLAADYADDDLVLICNAAQILLDPLVAIATALDKKTGDFTIVSHNDGSPSGVMLASCKTLRLIPETGFVDLKEQALAQIAKTYDVTVLHCRRPTGLPVRTMPDYVGAMRAYHHRQAGTRQSSDPLSEDWMPAFAIVEGGAVVDPRAHVHDAIVLKGAVVEAGAVVVRSIICPGGVVKKDRHAVDQMVCVADAVRN